MKPIRLTPTVRAIVVDFRFVLCRKMRKIPPNSHPVWTSVTLAPSRAAVEVIHARHAGGE